MKTDFLASTNHFLYIFLSRIRPLKAFFASSENESFLNESFIPVSEKDFPSSRNRPLYLSFFLLTETVTCMSGNQLFKDRTYFCRWKLIFWPVVTIFFHCFRYFSRSPSSRSVQMNFSVQKRKFCFLFRIFFHASENHYLD